MVSFRNYILIFIFYIFCFSADAGTKQWSGAVSVAWNVAGNWTGNSLPGNGDNIIIPGGLVNYPVASTNINIKNITVNSSGTGGKLTITANTLNAARLFVEAGGLLIISGGTLQVSEVSIDGTLQVSGTLASSGEIQVNSGGIINQSGGVVHGNASITSAPKTDIVINAGGVYNQSGGSLAVRDLLTGAGAFNQSGTTASFRLYRHWKMGAGSSFNATSGTVQFFGNGNQSDFASGTRQFANIIVNAAVNPGFSGVAGSTIPISGNFTNNNTALINTVNATFIFNGALNQTAYSAVATGTTFGNLEIDKSAGVLTLQSNIYIAGDVTVYNGTVDVLAFLLNRAVLGGQLVLLNGTLVLRGASGGIAGSNFPMNFTTVNLSVNSTVSYNGNNQTIAPVVYGNLQLTCLSGASVKSMNAASLTVTGNFLLSNGSGTSVVFNTAAAISISGNCTISTGATCNANTFEYSIGGHFLNTGTFNTSGKVIFNGSASQDARNVNPFHKLTINNTSGLVNLLTNITVNDSLHFVMGRISTSSFIVTLPSTGKVSGASQATGWVHGFLRLNVSAGAGIYRIFPVGDALYYAPVSFTLANVTNAGNVTAASISGDHPLIAGSQINTVRSVNRYWKFVNNGVAYTAGIFTINWNDADMDPGCDPMLFSTGTFLSAWDTVPSSNHQLTSLQAGPVTQFPDLITGEVCYTADIGLWSGIINGDASDASNWKCGILPDATIDVTIPAGALHDPLLNIGDLTVHNIIIEAGASFMVSNSVLNVAGAITSQGLLDITDGTLRMMGTTSQQIDPAGIVNGTVRNLITNNLAGVTLSGMITVRDMLKPEAGNLNTSGMLTLASDATLTAFVESSGSGNIAGAVTMQRYLPAGFGYKYLSSPFESATISSISDEVDLGADFPTVFRYDENRVSSGWVNYTDPSGFMMPLTGYGVNFGNAGSPLTIDMTGDVNNGSQSITLWNHNQPYTTGFNLVGNPYPSPVDWDAPAGWTKTNIDDAIYFFDASGSDQYGGSYNTYINGISSNGIAGNIIPSMQGFFVHVSDGSYPVSATLQINNSARATGFQPYYHRVRHSDDRPVIRLEAGFSTSNEKDVAVIYFEPGSSLLYEPGRDAHKLMNTTQYMPDIFSLSPEGYKLSVNGVGLPGQEFNIPIDIKANAEGRYQIRCTGSESISGDFNIYLADHTARINRDLRMLPVYEVLLGIGLHHNRFSLVITKDQLPSYTDNSEYGIYSHGSMIYLNINCESQSQVHFELSSVEGRSFIKRQLNNGMHQVATSLTDGIYIATVRGATSVFSKKIFIKGS